MLDDFWADFSENWFQACTITVAEAINVSEYTLNDGLGCELPAESSSTTSR
jgi:hypothetical protein